MTKERLVYMFLIFTLLSGCSPNNNQANHRDRSESSYSDENEYSDSETTEKEEQEEAYSDGTYCAEVSYYNSNTGTNSSYTLTVEVESNELTQINWPNGGWLDDDHFASSELDEDGYTSFTSDKGYDYEIQIIGEEAGCFIDVPDIQQCSGITEDGDQCENMTDNSNGFCWQHQDQE